MPVSDMEKCGLTVLTVCMAKGRGGFRRLKNALDLDSESLAIAQKQAIQWLSAKAAISDEWALRIAKIRAADKNTTGRGGGNSGTALIH